MLYCRYLIIMEGRTLGKTPCPDLSTRRTPPQVKKSGSKNNQLPRDLILALMVQGYP